MSAVRNPMTFKSVASVYFAQRGSYLKIGISRDPAKRIKQLRYSRAVNIVPDDARPIDDVRLILAVPGQSMGDEWAMHLRFESWRVIGEWFRLCDELLAELDEVRREVARGFTPHDWLTALCERDRLNAIGGAA